MKKWTAAILALILMLSLAVPAFAEDEQVTTEFTVVGSAYFEEFDSYQLVISYKEQIFATYDNQYHWYYTTSTIALSGIDLSSDGSENGNAALEAVKNHEQIPSGTVIDMTWSGMIAEVYPPDFMGVTAVKFTEKKTDYTVDEMVQEVGKMNEMRTGNFFSASDGVDITMPTQANAKEDGAVTVEYYTVIGVKRHEDTGAYELAMSYKDWHYNGFRQNLFYVTKILTLDPNDDSIIFGTDGSKAAERLLNAFKSFEEIPIGTVLEICTHAGETTADSFELNGIFEINFTDYYNTLFESQMYDAANEMNEKLEADKQFSLPPYPLDTMMFTVLNGRYNEKSGCYELALSRKEEHVYVLAENAYHDVFTTTVISIPDGTDIELTADFSRSGAEFLDAVKNREPLPAGVPVNLSWRGEMTETYPIEFPNITEIEFCGVGYCADRYDPVLNEDEINGELEALNELRVDDPYPRAQMYVDEYSDGVPGEQEYIPSGSGYVPEYRKTFVIVYVDEYESSEYWIYLTDYDGNGENIYKLNCWIGDGGTFISSDGTEEGYIKAMQFRWLSFDDIVGQVIDLEWNGMVLDSSTKLIYMEWADTIVMTSKKSPFTKADYEEFAKRIESDLDREYYSFDDDGFYRSVSPQGDGRMWHREYLEGDVVLADGAVRNEMNSGNRMARMTLVHTVELEKIYGSTFNILYFADDNGKLYRTFYFNIYGYDPLTVGDLYNVIWKRGDPSEIKVSGRAYKVVNNIAVDIETSLTAEQIAALSAEAEALEAASPKTGDSGALAWIALAGALAWSAAVISEKKSSQRTN